jgi:hypothetical protein
MPMGRQCAPRGHYVLDGRRLLAPSELPVEDVLDALEQRLPPEGVWRLCERVPEPDDHLHESPP